MRPRSSCLGANEFKILCALSVAAMFFPGVARADLSGTPTLSAVSSLDLDTGAITNAPNEAVDIFWDGSTFRTISPMASGYLVPSTGAAAFDALGQNDLAGFRYSSTFSASVPQVAVGAIFAFKTKNAHYAKVLITSVAQFSSLSARFLTYGAGGSGTSVQPSITSVQNNYGLIPPGLPNWGIAPGTLFFVKGDGLANVTTPLQSSAAPGLQTTLSGVSVKVSFGGAPVQCFLYYLSPTQIDAVLPGNSPLGLGTLTVTNNGVTSAGAQINVVASAFGILSYNGTLAATYDANNVLIGPSNAANPNQPIVVWGSGVGSDLANDDRLFPQKQNNQPGTFLRAFVGGVEAPISYKGRSQYPGVDQIVLTVPGNVPTGCYVSLVIVSSEIMVSNSTTIAVAATGKSCTDAHSPVSPQQYQAIAANGSVKSGTLGVAQTIGVNAASIAFGALQKLDGYAGTIGYKSVSIGSCVVSNSVAGPATTASALDGGPTITVNSSAGGSIALIQNAAFGPGVYGGLVPPGSYPPAGGTFTFDNGGGGSDVGHFSVALNFPASFAWTNPAQVTGITRSQGVTVTWSGGSAPGAFVGITGSVGAAIGSVRNTSVSFTCFAPLAAGTFTVPPAILLALPPGNGTLAVAVFTVPQTFTAPGLDLGLAIGTTAYAQNVSYDPARR